MIVCRRCHMVIDGRLEALTGRDPLRRIADISKNFSFEAAHQLLCHDGACRQPHGHHYGVTITLRGPINTQEGAPDEGMVMDFGELKVAWKQLEPLLDHQDLNQTIGQYPGDPCWPTSAENIAGWLMRQLLSYGMPVLSVMVAETPSSTATIYHPEIDLPLPPWEPTP